MKMKKKYKIILSIIILLIVVLGGFAIYHFVVKDTSTQEPPITNTTKVTNKIEGYDYSLEDRDTELFSIHFKELKENLENETPKQEEYIKSVAKLFIIDLYTIDNKISKYDIGGLEFLYQNAKESFKSKVLDSIYKTVEDNSYKTRKQELPIVKSIEITNLEETTYKIGKEKQKAYKVALNWTYEKELGYDKKGIVTLVEEDNKWSVVSLNPIK